MSFDPNEFEPAFNDWLPSEVFYEGPALAWFDGRDEPVAGLGVASVDEFGDCLVEITANVDDVYWRDEIAPLGQGGGGRPPVLARFEIKDTRGTFETEGRQDAGFRLGFPLPTGLRFIPHRSIFTANDAGRPVYWVVPLLNTFLDIRERPDWVDAHPLVFYSDSAIRHEIPTDSHHFVEHFSDTYVGVMTFEVQGRPAFIQRIPSSERLIAALEGGEKRSAVTAVAVGELADDGSTDIDPAKHFVFGIAPILTLATGTPVGLTWYEVRDNTGALARRFHRQWATPKYQKGRRTVVRSFKDGSGLGALLTKGLATFFGIKRSRVIVNRLSRTFDNDLTLDDQIEQACRALDILFGRLGSRKAKYFDRLDFEDMNALTRVIDDAILGVKGIRQAVKGKGQRELVGYLDSLAGKFRSDMKGYGPKTTFGLKVQHLVEKCGFLDLRVLDSAFAAGTIELQHSWTQMLDILRNDLVHDGFIGATTVPGVDEVAILNHLHDLSVRIILKECEYDGLYRPTMMVHEERAIDWVTASTTHEDLGYRHRRVRVSDKP